MSLTTAQKHDLIIAFNAQREEASHAYQSEKQTRKEEEKKSGTYKEKTGYCKLYKHLGTDNRNKDVRRQLQEEVNMYTDNQLSTNLH